LPSEFEKGLLEFPMASRLRKEREEVVAKSGDDSGLGAVQHSGEGGAVRDSGETIGGPRSEWGCGSRGVVSGWRRLDPAALATADDSFL
jgi:hypothetical protein